MQLANIVRERWKGVLFCLIVAIPATLLGKQVEVVGGPVFAILFGMVLGARLSQESSRTARRRCHLYV